MEFGMDRIGESWRPPSGQIHQGAKIILGDRDRCSMGCIYRLQGCYRSRREPSTTPDGFIRRVGW